MSLAQTRQAIAAAASTPGLDVRAWPTVKTPRPGDGWVEAGTLAPASFGALSAAFTVTVCLGSDAGKAEELFDEHAPAVLDAVTKAVACARVTLDPVALVVDQGGALHALQLKFTTEV